MSTSQFSKTPSVSVIDNRGLAVRHHQAPTSPFYLLPFRR